MPPAVGDQYQVVVAGLLESGTPVSIMWAGTDEKASEANVFLRVLLGPLLLELVADNQWSTQNRHVDTANHLHSVLRNLSFEWDFDPARLSDQHHDDP